MELLNMIKAKWIIIRNKVILLGNLWQKFTSIGSRNLSVRFVGFPSLVIAMVMIHCTPTKWLFRHFNGLILDRFVDFKYVWEKGRDGVLFEATFSTTMDSKRVIFEMPLQLEDNIKWNDGIYYHWSSEKRCCSLTFKLQYRFVKAALNSTKVAKNAIFRSNMSNLPNICLNSGRKFVSSSFFF